MLFYRIFCPHAFHGYLGAHKVILRVICSVNIVNKKKTFLRRSVRQLLERICILAKWGAFSVVTEGREGGWGSGRARGRGLGDGGGV